MSDLTKKERISKFGEVFTPPHIVVQMADLLEKEDAEVFAPEKTFLEPACGEGVMVLEILRRKFARCRTRADYSTALRSVWAMDIQERNVQATIRNVEALCRENFALTKKDLEVISDHIILCDSLKVMKLMGELNQRGGTGQ